MLEVLKGLRSEVPSGCLCRSFGGLIRLSRLLVRTDEAVVVERAEEQVQDRAGEDDADPARKGSDDADQTAEEEDASPGEEAGGHHLEAQVNGSPQANALVDDDRGTTAITP
jgi:hypothetical protein